MLRLEVVAIDTPMDALQYPICDRESRMAKSGDLQKQEEELHHSKHSPSGKTRLGQRRREERIPNLSATYNVKYRDLGLTLLAVSDFSFPVENGVYSPSEANFWRCERALQWS
ncbi:hypothetical protein ECG_05072 [Echinococcus granulosus]|nr:hypothetical protein ECG_05072 [Echinococcus granulosus]